MHLKWSCHKYCIEKLRETPEENIYNESMFYLLAGKNLMFNDEYLSYCLSNFKQNISSIFISFYSPRNKKERKHVKNKLHKNFKL